MRQLPWILAILACACVRGSDGRSIATSHRERTADTLTILDTVPISPEAEERVRWLRASTGTLVGRITDAAGDPVESAGVHGTTMGGYADESGVYEVVYLDPGAQSFTAEARGYRPATYTVNVAAGRVDTLNIVLERAAENRMRLEGTWSMRFHLREAGEGHPTPRSRFIEGRITFHDSITSPLPRETVERDPYVWTSFGYSDVDFSPFFGERVARDVSTAVFGSRDNDFEREAVGTVLDGDSVEIDLIPRISHGGVSLAARMDGDGIVGRWVQRAYCCGARGDVVLRRVE